MTSFEKASLVVSILGFIGLIVSVGVFGLQARAMNMQVQLMAIAAHEVPYVTVVEHMLVVDRVFVEHPECRPYFYEGKARPSKKNAQRHLVEAIAELVLDYFEFVIVAQTDEKTTYDAPWSDKFCADLFANSPVLCDYLESHRDWYPPILYERMSTNRPH